MYCWERHLDLYVTWWFGISFDSQPQCGGAKGSFASPSAMPNPPVPSGTKLEVGC